MQKTLVHSFSNIYPFPVGMNNYAFLNTVNWKPPKADCNFII